MSGITLEADFGEGKVTVEISSPAGAGAENYSIYFNRYYQGRVWRTQHFGWQHDINPKSPLETADIAYIIELLGGNWFTD